MAFEGLTLRDWNQFEELQLTFSRSCTVITGANGAGKSTVLRILAKHAGWEFYDLRVEALPRAEHGPDVPAGHKWIGEIRYRDPPPAVLSQEPAPSKRDPRIQVTRLRTASCIFIPAVRPTPPYRAGGLPTVPPFTPRDALRDVDQALRALNEGEMAQRQNPLAYVASYLLQDFQGRQIHPQIAKFIETAKRLLPPEIGFTGFDVLEETLVIRTTDGPFHFGAASGGISTLITVAWLCTMFEAAEGGGTVLFDEPENHLHPALQRKVLPTLVDSFKEIQFIVATHSPLVLGSVRGASEYALHFTERGVRSVDLGPLIQAGTAGDFLEDILGVSFSGPIWAEEALIENYEWLRHQPITRDVLDEYEARMTDSGLTRFVPKQLVRALRDRLGGEQ